MLSRKRNSFLIRTCNELSLTFACTTIGQLSMAETKGPLRQYDTILSERQRKRARRKSRAVNPLTTAAEGLAAALVVGAAIHFGPEVWHDLFGNPDHFTGIHLNPPDSGDHHTATPDAPTVIPIDTAHGHIGYYTMEQLDSTGNYRDTITFEVFDKYIKQTAWGHDLNDQQARELYDMCHQRHVSANYLLATAETFPSHYNNVGAQIWNEGEINPLTGREYDYYVSGGVRYIKFPDGYDGLKLSEQRFMSIVERIANHHNGNATVQEDEGDYFGQHDEGITLKELIGRIEGHMKDHNLESLKQQQQGIDPVEGTSHVPATQIAASVATDRRAA